MEEIIEEVTMISMELRIIPMTLLEIVVIIIKVKEHIKIKHKVHTKDLIIQMIL